MNPLSNNYYNKDDEDDRQPRRPPAIPKSGAVFRSVSMAVTAPPLPSRFLSADSPAAKLHGAHSSSSQFRPSSKQSSSSTSFVWEISENSLPAVPVFHPLGRCAITVKTVPLKPLAARISDFLKAKSISCTYHEHRVDCVTASSVKFSLQLWQGPTQGSTIIEIQRTNGCCIELKTLRCQMIDAIRNGVSQQQQQQQQQQEPQQKKKMPVAPVPLNSRAVPPIPPPRGAGDASDNAELDMCHQSLESDRLDEKHFGLESLCVLTDPSKIAPEMASEVSSKVVSDVALQSLLKQFFTVNSNTLGSTSLHLMAIKALSNALSLVSSKSGTNVDIKSPFWDTVLQGLYYNLKNSNERPIEASYSIKCLRLLQTLEPSTLDTAPSQQYLSSYLQKASQFGAQHNRSLERETEDLMVCLGSVH